MSEMTLGELTEKLNGELSGNPAGIIRGVGSLRDATSDQVSFLSNVRYEKYVSETKAAAVIVSADYSGKGPPLIRCADPYFAFRSAMVMFHGFREAQFEGSSPRASVDPTAEIADDVKIGPFVTIAANTIIGQGTVIYPGVYIGENCEIGRHCTLHANVTLYEGCILRDRVTIHANSSIGQDGFGYATHDGKHEKIPQPGWVEIESDVEIGSCCAIDRGTLGPTVIGEGTKFSNEVVIGHGTKIGKHCLFAAQSGIAGSAVVGDHVVFGAQSGAVGHIHIGDGARIAGQAGVTNDVRPGQDLLGSPAFPLAQARRALGSLPRLPDLRKAVRRIARDLTALKRRFEPPSDDESDSQEGS